ncbi:hypothetical protein GCM10009714_11190 [Microlunatus capsulatus]
MVLRRASGAVVVGVVVVGVVVVGVVVVSVGPVMPRSCGGTRRATRSDPVAPDTSGA